MYRVCFLDDECVVKDSKNNIVMRANTKRAVSYYSFPYMLPLLCTLYITWNYGDREKWLNDAKSYFGEKYFSSKELFKTLVKYFRGQGIAFDEPAV